MKTPRPPSSALAALASAIVALGAPAAVVGEDDPPTGAPPRDGTTDGPAATETPATTAADDPDGGDESGAWPYAQIDMAGLQEAFRLLRERYIHRERLTPLEINRAALKGVLDRLEFGADLIVEPPPREAEENADPDASADTGGQAEQPGDRTATAVAPVKGVFAAQTLAPGFGYLRPGTFTEDELEPFDAALDRFNAEGTPLLILDLRSPIGQGAFEIAAALADRFLPENAPIFRIVRPGEDRPRVFVSRQPARWTGRTVVLLDTASSNVAETLAAILRNERDAFIVGSPTSGRTVEYQRVAIGEGIFLNLAVAEMILPDGTSLFRKGLEPDFLVPFVPDESWTFVASDEPDVDRRIFEAQRPRLNEAALVAGTNPELPYLIERSRGKPTAFDAPPAVDRVLQRAVDVLVADKFLGRPER